MRRPLLPLLLCLALLAGCGNERFEAPDLTAVAEPAGAERFSFPDAGLSFEAPRNWLLQKRPAPAVFSIQYATAFVTGLAYEREEDLPRTPAELAEAERRLRAEVRERDPEFEIRSSRIREVAGEPAIELRGSQVLSGRELQTRSVHVFAGEVEYVFEALAPPDAFERASGGVLRQVLASARLRGSLRGDRAED